MSDSYSKRLHDALVEEHKLFFDYSTRALKPQFADNVGCPVCSAEGEKAFEKDWFVFKKCKACNMVFPSPRLNAEATFRFYNGKFSEVYNESKFDPNIENVNEDDRLNLANLDTLLDALGNQRGKILELGPGGRGSFLRGARDKGFECYGVEFGEENCRRLKEFFGADRIFNKDLCDINFEPEQFEAVYMRDVFEHVLAPKKILQDIHRILKPGGVISIEVPNSGGLVYRLVGKRHVCIFGFAHVNYWTPESLEKILSLTGFETIKTYHKSSEDVIPWTLAHYYFGDSTFTSLNQHKAGFFGRTIVRAVGFAGRILGLNKFLPKWANEHRLGSQVNIIARKKA